MVCVVLYQLNFICNVDRVWQNWYVPNAPWGQNRILKMRLSPFPVKGDLHGKILLRATAEQSLREKRSV